jgi:CRP-like cAMP-binding protein
MPLAIKDVPFFKGLSDEELKAVQGCLKEKSFEKGESLFLEGNSCEKVFFVRAGRVKLTRTSSVGREQILETLGPGDTCACNPGSLTWHCASTAIALAPVSAWFLSRESYVRLVQTNSKLSQALNRLFAERLQCFSALIEEVSLKDSRKRLIKFLLDMLSENEGKEVLALDFTQEELAHRIGAARETVTRQLHQLKSEKFIDIKPHQIVIKNRSALEKLL